MIIPDHQVVFKLSEMVRGKSPVVLHPNKVTGSMYPIVFVSIYGMHGKKLIKMVIK